MVSNKEKKDRRIAMLSSIGIHGAVVLLMIFIAAWRAPNPPLPEYGIELNFGLDDQGTGDVQPDQQVGTNETAEDDEPKPSVEDASSPEENETDEVENTEAKPVEQEVASKIESPVSQPEKKEEVKTETPQKPVEERVEQKIPSKPKEEPKVVYQPNKKSTSTGTATDKEGTPTSQGDSHDKTGDKGNPEGSVDAKALYGKQGGGSGGSSLEIAGWLWDEIPKPDVADNESGRIVFQIKVNEEGLIENIRTLETTVSPATERACREEIQRLSFTKTGANVPEISTGKITFVIRSK
jgi:periplasmic protein TonB